MTQPSGRFDAARVTQPPTRGWWPLAIGLVCMLVLAPLCFGAGLWFGVNRGLSAFQGGDWTTSTSKQLDAATSYVVFGAHGTSTQSQARCGAVAPSGTFISFASSSGSVTLNDQSEVGTFTTSTAGNYRLECGDISLKVIGQKQVDGLGKNIGIPVVIGLGSAALLGLLGLILTIVGIVRLVGSGNRRKQWQLAQQPQWRPGPPQGPDQQWGPGPQ